MPSTINWYLPGRVLYIRLSGDVTVAEMEESSAGLLALLNAGTPLVYIVLDDSALKSVPTSLSQLRKSLPFLRHPSLGWALAVGKVNPVFSFISGLVASVFRVRHRRFDTLPEALEFLKQVDVTLDWTTADSAVVPQGEQPG